MTHELRTKLREVLGSAGLSLLATPRRDDEEHGDEAPPVLVPDPSAPVPPAAPAAPQVSVNADPAPSVPQSENATQEGN